MDFHLILRLNLHRKHTKVARARVFAFSTFPLSLRFIVVRLTPFEGKFEEIKFYFIEMEMYAKKVNTELKSFLIKLIAERKRGKVGKNSNEP